MALQTIPGRAIELGSDTAGDVAYYDGTKWTRLAKGTSAQVLKMNTGATAPEWVTPTVTAAPGADGNVLTSDGTNWASETPATPQTANEINYVAAVAVGSAGTWTKPAGVNRIFLYLTDRISNDGAATASYIYWDVTNVTSYAYSVYTYGNPTKYGSLTFNGRNGGSASSNAAPDTVVTFFGEQFPGPQVSTSRPYFYIIGYAA